MIVIILSSWWFVRNYIIYDGDILGLTTCDNYGEKYAMEEYKPSNIQTPERTGLTVGDMLIDMGWAKITYKSFIGMFGAMNILLPKLIYLLYSTLFLVCIVGLLAKAKLLFGLKYKDIKVKKKLAFNIAMFIAMIIPNILNIYYSYTADYQPQGRYSLPMIIPLMYFLCMGLENIIERMFKNNILKKIIQIGVCMFCITVAIFALTNIIIPYYNK